MKVPFVNPREHYRRLKPEIDGAIFDCLENGDLIHRKQLFAFEASLAAYVGVKHVVGLASGYHALLRPEDQRLGIPGARPSGSNHGCSGPAARGANRSASSTRAAIENADIAPIEATMFQSANCCA